MPLRYHRPDLHVNDELSHVSPELRSRNGQVHHIEEYSTTLSVATAEMSSRVRINVGRGEYPNLVRPKRRHRIDGWKKSASDPLPT